MEDMSGGSAILEHHDTEASPWDEVVSADAFLDRPIEPEQLQALDGHEDMPPEANARAMALALAPPERGAWMRFLDRVFLALGAALVLAGIIFFFAYNWSGLTRFQKFGLVEVLLVGLVMGSLRLGLDRPAGRICLAAAAVLIGPLLAVYGQAYQTGADAYTLFLTWGLLTLPWALAVRLPGLWLLPLLLLNLSWVLYHQQVAADSSGLFLVLFLVNGAAWFAWEQFRGKGAEWMAGREFTCVASILVLVPLTLPACAAAAWSRDGEDQLALGLLLVLWIFLLNHFRKTDPSLFVLAMVLTSVISVCSFFGAWIIFEGMDMEEFGVLLMAFLILTQVAGAARWLRDQSRQGVQA